MSTEKLFWINGTVVPEKDAVISIQDLGLLRGFGIFDFFRTYNKKPFHLKEHLDRFFYSAQKVGLVPPYDRNAIKAHVEALIQKSPHEDISIKIVLTGGQSDDAFFPGGKCHYWLQASPLQKFVSNKPYAIKSLMATRELFTVKSLNYLQAIIGVKQAKAQGFDDILYVDSQEIISESSTSNVFFISEKKLFTPSERILKGITREVVLKLAKDDFEICIQKINLNDIKFMEECFITSTTRELLPVGKVDAILFNSTDPNSSTSFLKKKFEDYASQSFRFDLDMGFDLETCRS